ncbi:hypothetical protein [Nocardioides daejeonensis]|uniref:hypothetical protein n=1 Tax=Nocardioides daejeonensis TaxID=1046556 RepID=UPI000D745AE9|nr:hypothetical protein [Nocardioides daejeonensis]
MAPVHIEGVDERDSAWEHAHPRFRVYLHGGAEESAGGWTDTYDITGADVLQVIDWAQRQAQGSMTFAVALVCDDVERERLALGHGRGLVWLVGMDGNDVAQDPSEVETQRRMLTRREHPVGIPEADRMRPTTSAR